MELVDTVVPLSGHRWSPKGTKVSYAATIGDTVEIHVVDVEASSDILIAFTRKPDTFSFWSRDGRWLAVGSTDSEMPGIYVRNPTGVNQFRRTEAQDFMPIWSPKADRIAFLSLRDGNQEIYVMNGDGSEQTRLTENDAKDYQMAWSPDGKRLAFRI